MKKIVVIGFLVLSMAGAFAGEEPQQEARMMSIDDLVQEFSRQFAFGPSQQNKLERELKKIATPADTVEFNTAESIAKSMAGPQDVQGEEVEKEQEGSRIGKALVKTPEQVKIEGAVREFLPGTLAELVGSYLPAAWNIQFKKDEEFLVFEHQIKFQSIKTSANGRYVALRCLPKPKTIEIRLWDMVTMKWDDTRQHQLSYHHHSRLIWDISPTGDLLAYQHDKDKDIVIIDLTIKADQNRIKRIIKMDPVEMLSFTPDGSEIIAYARREGKMQTWNVETGNLVPEKTKESKDLPEGERNPAGGMTNYSIISSDGKKIAMIEGKSICSVWDLNRKKVIRKFEVGAGRTFIVHSVVFDTEGERIAIINHQDADKIFLGIWNLVTGIQECDIPLPDRKKNVLGFSDTMAFSPDRQFLATTFDVKGGFRVWNLPEFQRIYKQQQIPAKRVTVDEYMETLAGLMPESELDEVRKQLRELSQTSPDGKIEESLAQQQVDDMLHASAPRVLVKPEKPMSAPGEVEEKEGAAAPQAPGVSKRITVGQALKEPAFSGLPAKQQRVWEKELKRMAAQSADRTIKYGDVWQLFDEIKNIQSF